MHDSNGFALFSGCGRLLLMPSLFMVHLMCDFTFDFDFLFFLLSTGSGSSNYNVKSGM